ncbi:MAG: thermonuclease family protein [Desulfobulbus sp.]
MIRIFLFGLAILLLSSPCFAYSGTVVSVYDGDSITMLYKGKKIRVSLYGIDAPELKQEHGNEARDFLDSFIKNETVEAQPIGKLRKGRMNGIILLGEDNINELMILNGQAWVDRKACTEKYCVTWIKMEEAAKATKKGLWKSPEPIPPWDFRKTGTRKKIAPPKTHIKAEK